MNVLLVCTISVSLALKPRNGMSRSKEICLFKFADNLKLFLESSLPVYTMTSIVHMYVYMFVCITCLSTLGMVRLKFLPTSRVCNTILL